MATVKQIEVFECPNCEHREETLDTFRAARFICENCDSEYYNKVEAEECCLTNDDEEEIEED